VEQDIAAARETSEALDILLIEGPNVVRDTLRDLLLDRIYDFGWKTRNLTAREIHHMACEQE
jgi:hypothetical protein